MNYYPIVKAVEPKWTRSEDGILFGVCEGLGKAYNFDPNYLRIFLFISAVFFGSGLLAYLLVGLVLPRQDKIKDYHEQKFLGVCYRLHLRTGIELGILRLLVVAASLASVGIVFLGYFALALFMPRHQDKIIW